MIPGNAKVARVRCQIGWPRNNIGLYSDEQKEEDEQPHQCGRLREYVWGDIYISQSRREQREKKRSGERCI